MSEKCEVNVACEVACVVCGGPGAELPGLEAGEAGVRVIDNRENILTPCEAYHKICESSDSEFLVYVHDDVSVFDPQWLKRVLGRLTHPNTGVVGLGGAIALGSRDLYKRPYRLSDMARAGYFSNQTDWKTHGQRETGERRVAVVDAFFMAVRKSLLKQAGGWPTRHLTHHCLDLWVCCEAARQGKEVWIVGVECTHHGGGSSTKDLYRNASWLQGGTLEKDHQTPHVWLHDRYRDVLPLEVK